MVDRWQNQSLKRYSSRLGRIYEYTGVDSSPSTSASSSSSTTSSSSLSWSSSASSASPAAESSLAPSSWCFQSSRILRTRVCAFLLVLIFLLDLYDRCRQNLPTKSQCKYTCVGHYKRLVSKTSACNLVHVRVLVVASVAVIVRSSTDNHLHRHDQHLHHPHRHCSACSEP